MKEKIKTEIKNHYIRYIFIIIGILYFGGVMAQGIDLIIKAPAILAGTVNKSDLFTMNPISSIWISVSTIKGIICSLITIGIAWLGYFYGIKPRIKEETGQKDDRNFIIADEGTYGTSSLMKENEIREILDMETELNKEGNILGQYKGKILTLPSNKEFEEKRKKNNWDIKKVINNKLNNNQVVIGAPGTMKSRAFARNLIFQAAKREESLVITDPKGELVEDTKVYLEKAGYKVRILNLVNPRASDSWDCVASLGGDSIVAKIFADTIANNAGAGNDRYWIDNASIIFKAVSLYVVESENEPVKTMGRIYDLLSEKTLTELEELFLTLKPTSVARRAFNSFNRSNENVKGQILNGISTMLAVFQDDTIRKVTDADEINLEEACYEKCAYFLIMSDQHKSFDFLAVLFYAMSFVQQVEAIDRERGKEKAGLKFRKTRPITYLMDEFSNLGQIPDFTKKISTVRSRNINITIIIQNIPQLKNRYPNDQWQEILGCCDTMIFLGCTDQMTADYISSRTGIATIEVESTNSTYDRQVVVFNQETSYHEVKSRGQRKVMNQDEILRLKNTDELVFLRCQKPLLCQKFDFTLHPESNKIEKCSVADHIPEWKRKEIARQAEAEAKSLELIRTSKERMQKELEQMECEKRVIPMSKPKLYESQKREIISPTIVENKENIESHAVEQKGRKSFNNEQNFLDTVNRMNIEMSEEITNNSTYEEDECEEYVEYEEYDTEDVA